LLTKGRAFVISLPLPLLAITNRSTSCLRSMSLS
jgi:hypothetical protein